MGAAACHHATGFCWSFRWSRFLAGGEKSRGFEGKRTRGEERGKIKKQGIMKRWMKCGWIKWRNNVQMKNEERENDRRQEKNDKRMTFGHVWTGQRTSRRVQCLHRRENHGRGKRSTFRYRTYCARNLQRKLSAWSSCGSLIHARDSSGGNLVTQRRIACEMEGRNQIDIKKKTRTITMQGAELPREKSQVIWLLS